MIHDAIGPKRKACPRCRQPLPVPHPPEAERCPECVPGYVAPKVGLIGPWDPAVHTAINHVQMAIVLGQLGCGVVGRAAQQSSSDWQKLARLERDRREVLSW